MVQLNRFRSRQKTVECGVQQHRVKVVTRAVHLAGQGESRHDLVLPAMHGGHAAELRPVAQTTLGE